MPVSHNYAVDALAALERKPEATAIASGAVAVTNGEVAARVRLYAMHMMARGVTPTSCVVIAIRNAPTAFMVAFAAGLLGARWVGLHPKLPFQLLGTTHLLHGRERPAGLTHPGMYEVDAGWARAAEGWPDVRSRRFTGFASPDDPALITKSSGTTGVPKFMIRTCARVSASLRQDDLSAYRAVSTLFPLTSSLGFRLCTTAILAGVPVVLPTKVTGEAATIKLRDVDYVVGSPAQVDAFCEGVEPLSSRFGTLWAGGSIMTPDALRHWLGYFEKVVLHYGAREGGGSGSMTLTEIDDRTEIAYTLRPDTRVEIVAEDGTPCPPSVPGIVRLRTPTMATGYIGDPEASAEAFRDGWFYPGDLGLLTPDGRLKILGRVKDQLNLGGLKFNAADVDHAAKSVPGIVDAMCFSTPTQTGLQQLSLCAVRDPHLDEAATAAAIRAACKSRVNRGIELSAVYFVRTLPINDNGKKVRDEGPRVASGRPAF